MEQWQAVPGFWGDYEASTAGRVRSWKHRGGGRLVVPHVLLPHLSRGRPRYCLQLFGKEVACTGARLVCLAFHGEPPGEGFHAHHKNRDRADNHPGNLCWMSARDHRSQHPGKLSTEDVIAIRRSLAAGARPVDLAPTFGVSRQAISDIKHNKSHRLKQKESPGPPGLARPASGCQADGIMNNEDHPTLSSGRRQGARIVGSWTRITKNGRALYARHKYALAHALSQGWTEDPKPPGIAPTGRGREAESQNPTTRESREGQTARRSPRGNGERSG